jgi:hypothetical protein
MNTGGLGNSGYTTSIINASSGTTIPDVSTVLRGTPIRVTVALSYGTVGVRPLGVIPADKQVIGVTTMIRE